MQSIHITAAEFEPVTLADLKRHTVVGHDEDDHVLFGFIEDAVEQVESDTGRAMVEQTWRLVGDCFPEQIVVPRPPLVSVVFIKYVDVNGDEQTLDPADYKVVVRSADARIKPTPGKCWPSVQSNNDEAVRVEFVCGYVTDDGAGGFSGRIPRRARQAILIWAAHLYNNRELTSPVQQHELPSYQRCIAGLEIYS